MLTNVTIKGFKSILDQSIDLGRINILIGANGAGKSNFISFFKMMRQMLSGKLQLFIGISGGADSLLYYASKVTTQIESEINFTDHNPSRNYTYSNQLIQTAQDSLIFNHESLSLFENDQPPKKSWVTSDSGYKETTLSDNPENQLCQKFRQVMSRCKYFQFHDTSETAKIKRNVYINDNIELHSDAGNLAAILYTLKHVHTAYYQRIVSTLQQIMPFFGDFVLEENKLNKQQILLNWKESRSDLIFGPYQLSDGSLRLIALVTLLMQPEEDMPEIIIIDEPELGLHPHAIETIISLIRYASRYSQIIIATQSSEMLDYFELDEIIITNRTDQQTIFRRLDENKLQEWRKEYSMSELWRKNVIGGGPLQ
ncbi:recombinase RecF [Candidatus Magnetomorum sp. HK-1]|nr:recombinase RecF [Candidatus Magnetomorum sp. HK-1]